MKVSKHLKAFLRALIAGLKTYGGGGEDPALLGKCKPSVQ